MPKYVLEYDHDHIYYPSATGSQILGEAFVEYEVLTKNILAKDDEEALRQVDNFVKDPVGIFEPGTQKERVLTNRPRKLIKEIKIWER
jgi:hypothetical protein